MKDFSYGVVPIYRKANEWQVLIVHQLSHRGTSNRFWIFPKGHSEGEETKQQTALRELHEETGVTAVKLETRRSFGVTYSFFHDGQKIEKEVEYFIGYCDNQDTVITQPKEIIETKWVSFAEAKDLLAHQNSRDVLADVMTFLEKNDDV